MSSGGGPCWRFGDSELLDEFQFSPHSCNFSDLAGREAKHIHFHHLFCAPIVDTL